MNTNITDLLAHLHIFEEIDSVEAYIEPEYPPMTGEKHLKEMNVFEIKAFSVLSSYKDLLNILTLSAEEIIAEAIAVDMGTLKGAPKYEKRFKLIHQLELKIAQVKSKIRLLEALLVFSAVADQADARVTVFFRQGYNITYKEKTCIGCSDCPTVRLCEYQAAINT